MMKLKFGDVLEYVRAGEDDPKMETVIRRHPDGPELLDQARLMLGMMRLRSGRRSDDGPAASWDRAESRVDMRSLSLEAPIESLRRSDSMVMREESAGEPVMSLRATRRSGAELGTLHVTMRGKQGRIAFKPEASAKVPSDDEDHGVAGTDSLVIQGARFTIALADTLSADEALAICLTDRARQAPASDLELIFMPDTGPFVKLLTDRNGVVELAPPVQPGVLRIESRPSQLLRIKLT